MLHCLSCIEGCGTCPQQLCEAEVAAARHEYDLLLAAGRTTGPFFKVDCSVCAPPLGYSDWVDLRESKPLESALIQSCDDATAAASDDEHLNVCCAKGCP